MIIEKIVKKNDENVIVHLKDGDKLFLAKEVVLKNGLRKGDKISDDLSLFLIKENQHYFIRKRAFNYLGRRPHSRFELFLKLRTKKYDIGLINSVLDELENKNYINDYDFALAFTKDKIQFKHFGTYRIKNELVKKRVPREIIEKVIEEFFPEGNDINEAIFHLKKKMLNKNIDELKENKQRNKYLAFLVRKGFNFDTANQAIKKFIMDNSINA